MTKNQELLFEAFHSDFECFYHLKNVRSLTQIETWHHQVVDTNISISNVHLFPTQSMLSPLTLSQNDFTEQNKISDLI